MGAEFQADRYNFINDRDLMANLKGRGFRQLVMTDGYDSTWRQKIDRGPVVAPTLPAEINATLISDLHFRPCSDSSATSLLFYVDIKQPCGGTRTGPTP
jgi:hypothetical protein